MQIGADLVADAQPLELMQPGEAAFDDPAVPAQPGPVRHPAAGDAGLDAPGAYQAAVLVVVITPVGVEDLGAAAGRPTRPRIGGIASSRGISWVTSLRCPPVNVTARGRPPASVIRWCLEPGRPRSTGLGPTSSPL